MPTTRQPTTRQTLAEVRRSIQSLQTQGQRLVTQVRKEGPGATTQVRNEAERLLAIVESRAVRLQQQLNALRPAPRRGTRQVRRRTTTRRQTRVTAQPRV